jgi:hypothetical protein
MSSWGRRETEDTHSTVKAAKSPNEPGSGPVKLLNDRSLQHTRIEQRKMKKTTEIILEFSLKHVIAKPSCKPSIVQTRNYFSKLVIDVL